MSYPMTINWVANADPIGLIAPSQSNAVAPYAMTLVGNRPYVYPKNCGFRRNVALTSTSNNSGVDFVITGITYSYPDGFKVTSETLTGPNGDTVLSDDIYVQINSIVASGAFTNVTATVGDSGDALVLLDYHRKTFNVSVEADFSRVSPVTVGEAYATSQIINLPTYNGLVFDFDPALCVPLNSAGEDTGNSITIPTISFPLTGLIRFDYFTPSSALYFKFGNFTSTPGTYAGGCPFTVMQQGLTS